MLYAGRTDQEAGLSAPAREQHDRDDRMVVGEFPHANARDHDVPGCGEGKLCEHTGAGILRLMAKQQAEQEECVSPLFYNRNE